MYFTRKTLLAALAVATMYGSAATAQQKDDWAKFGRYEAANAALTEAPKAILMGNSITELWNRTRPEFFTENGLLCRGISGQTSSQMLVRFRADVLDLKPRIVVICAGTNDLALNTGYISHEHILDNLESMVELARVNGIRPILCAVPPAGEYGWRKGLEPAPKIIRLNAMIRAYAEAEGIPYVDYHTPMAAEDGSMIAAYTNDGVHPIDAGYEVMEGILLPVIRQVEAQIAAPKKACKAKKQVRR